MQAESDNQMKWNSSNILNLFSTSFRSLIGQVTVAQVQLISHDKNLHILTLWMGYNEVDTHQCSYFPFQRDCPSGQLSKKKFIEVYSSFFPTGDADQFCTHVFRTFDKDNSGKIDFNEFLLAINITSGGQPKEKLEWAFQMYDIDGNGTIEKKEMTEIIKVRWNSYSHIRCNLL